MHAAKDSPRILIVDDDYASRTIMSKILTLEGYHADMAEGGRTALSLVGKNVYQLAILDYRMPEMNGVELFARMRELRPEIVGIFLTGYPTVDTVFPAISDLLDVILHVTAAAA
jgi:DNA-binding NtrC family response regulator